MEVQAFIDIVTKHKDKDEVLAPANNHSKFFKVPCAGRWNLWKRNTNDVLGELILKRNRPSVQAPADNDKRQAKREREKKKRLKKPTNAMFVR